MYRDYLIFTYRYRRSGEEWDDVREPVPLTWTACNFGGERLWFLCPGAGCGRRVAVLYGPRRYFLCRHCYGLSYQSRRDNKMYRALHRAQDIRERFGGSASMMEPFPEKPKGMHWRTYERLRWEHPEAEMEQLAGMREWLDRLEGKSTKACLSQASSLLLTRISPSIWARKRSLMRAMYQKFFFIYDKGVG